MKPDEAWLLFLNWEEQGEAVIFGRTRRDLRVGVAEELVFDPERQSADSHLTVSVADTYAFACLHFAEQYLVPAQALQMWLDGRASSSQTAQRCCTPKSLTLTRHEALCDSLHG